MAAFCDDYAAVLRAVGAARLMLDPAYLAALRSICQPVRAADFPRSLEPMRALLAELGNPHTRFPSVVVAGSVGKGTTCWRIAEGLWMATGPVPYTIYEEAVEYDSAFKVGLYTGPHLHSFRERFVINGAMISHTEFIEGAKAVTEAAARLDYHYSTFELATALALWWLARQQVKIAVLEVGMGGRWDAVNVVPNVLAVITSIEKEHLAMLGGSLQTIAWHKAGIMQPGGYAVTVVQREPAHDIFQSEAERLRIQLETPERWKFPYDDELIGGELVLLAGYRLMENAFVSEFSYDASYQMGLPGRTERAEVGGKRVVIDGAHTRKSAQRLYGFIQFLVHGEAPVRIVIGMLGDKAVNEVLSVFDQPRFHIVLTQAPSHRALSPDALNEKAHLQHATVEIVQELADALAQVHTAPESLFVVTGSLRMAAAAREAFGLLTPEALAEAQATRAIFEGEDYLQRLV